MFPGFLLQQGIQLLIFINILESPVNVSRVSPSTRNSVTDLYKHSEVSCECFQGFSFNKEFSYWSLLLTDFHWGGHLKMSSFVYKCGWVGGWGEKWDIRLLKRHVPLPLCQISTRMYFKNAPDMIKKGITIYFPSYLQNHFVYYKMGPNTRRLRLVVGERVSIFCSVYDVLNVLYGCQVRWKWSPWL